MALQCVSWQAREDCCVSPPLEGGVQQRARSALKVIRGLRFEEAARGWIDQDD